MDNSGEIKASAMTPPSVTASAAVISGARESSSKPLRPDFFLAAISRPGADRRSDVFMAVGPQQRQQFTIYGICHAGAFENKGSVQLHQTCPRLYARISI